MFAWAHVLLFNIVIQQVSIVSVQIIQFRNQRTGAAIHVENNIKVHVLVQHNRQADIQFKEIFILVIRILKQLGVLLRKPQLCGPNRQHLKGCSSKLQLGPTYREIWVHATCGTCTAKT